MMDARRNPLNKQARQLERYHATVKRNKKYGNS